MLLIKKACIPCLRMCVSFVKSSPGLYHHIYSFEFLYLNYFQNIFPIFLNWILFFLSVQKYFFSPMEKSFLLAFQKNFFLFAALYSVSQFWKCFLNFDIFSFVSEAFSQFWKLFFDFEKVFFVACFGFHICLYSQIHTVQNFVDLRFYTKNPTFLTLLLTLRRRTWDGT